MGRVLLLGLLLAVGALVLGCDKTPSSSFAYIQEASDAEVQVTANLAPYASLEGRDTFAIDLGEHAEDRVAQKQFAVLLADQLIARGYRLVDTPEEAALRFRLNMSNEAKEFYVPPRTYTKKVRVPEQTAKVKQDHAPFETSTITIPAHDEDREVTEPGYTYSRRCPTIELEIADAAKLRQGGSEDGALLWECRAVGITKLDNPILQGQFVLRRLVREVPLQQDATPVRRLFSQAGLNLLLATPNGTEFFPVVSYVERGSLAAKAGFIDYDAIVSIDEVSTSMMSTTELATRLLEDPAAHHTLRLVRGDSVRTLTFSLTPPPEKKR